jgi:hypothetical protein
MRCGDVWTRKDVQLIQSWYRPEEVTSALAAAGFINICVTDRRGNHLQRWDVNKAFFSATKVDLTSSDK